MGLKPPPSGGKEPTAIKGRDEVDGERSGEIMHGYGLSPDLPFSLRPEISSGLDHQVSQIWARGYFAASSGNVTDEVIKQYIQSQGEKPPDDQDNFQVADL